MEIFLPKWMKFFHFGEIISRLEIISPLHPKISTKQNFNITMKIIFPVSGKN